MILGRVHITVQEQKKMVDKVSRFVCACGSLANLGQWGDKESSNLQCNHLGAVSCLKPPKNTHAARMLMKC